MKSRDFVFWLQGFFELGGGKDGLTAEQVDAVKVHLGLVFRHDADIAAKPHAPLSISEGTASAMGRPLDGILIC